MLSVTKVLYGANNRKYAMIMSQLKTTSVVIPDDLFDTLLNFQK